MKNIKLILEYDGGKYSGWQRQKNAVTIQEMIENGILKVTGENISVDGCSRTDAGVHAKEFVCNFHTNSRIEAVKFRGAINASIPKDIRVLSSCEVDEKFHSRYNCKGKTYSYTIINRDVAPAIFRNYMHHVRASLDIDKMKQASECLVGTHDFKAFRKEGSSVKTTVRTITRIDIEKSQDIVRIYATADGFLYNMMRIICATLIEAGTGKRKPESVKEALESLDRNMVRKAAPAHALCLEKVYY
ncbi:tRNA pseudouridine(38-40) synthase TruA [Clostridium oryzae]|uniref:tRNA pseudouridine synthase A n=1 Tax=Clostridium oryzae TaxID=1450648 RepID=A0A1V4IKW0_9CLOT|nr:tRNA pseudouridine(38-40) synthase TruA [Clostridium oryzae]OPJ60661.1 tRNA pseudouridine synthase A [Clostridium oryzae]